MNQASLPWNHQPNKSNLQEPKKNEDGTSSIPTTLNGVTKVNCNAKSQQKYSDSIENHINKLRQTINESNKDKYAHSKIGDSNIKGYVCNLQTILSNNYGLYSVVKPGSSTSELKETAKEEVSQLSHDDLIVICSDSSDYKMNKFSSTFKNFIKTNNHTNIILINVPFRYDLLNSTSVNSSISTLNKRLKTLVKVFSQISFLKTDNNRNLFTIASLLHLTFKHKTYDPIILGWHNEIQVNSNLICEANQVKLSNRNSSHKKKFQ